MDKLKEVIISMLQENTGTHMLDSGGAYGRHWERNKKLPSDVEFWDNTPVITPVVYGGTNPEFWGTISIYHHLINGLEWDDEVEYLNRLFQKWDELHDYDSWDKAMKTFYEAILVVDKKTHNRKQYPNYRSEWDIWFPWNFYTGNNFYSGYTYNHENSLSQDFVYIVMGEFVFIQIHNGCDARGGFTRPVLFRLVEENLFNCDDYTIYCDNRDNDENHYWDKQGYNSYYTETDVELENVEKIDYDEATDEQKDEFDMYGIISENPEIIFSDESQNILPGFDVRYRKPAGNKKLVIKDKQPYCPICGGKLFLSKYYSG